MLGFYIQWLTPHQSIGLLWLHWWWSWIMIHCDKYIVHFLAMFWTTQLLAFPLKRNHVAIPMQNLLETKPETNIEATSNSLKLLNQKSITLGFFRPSMHQQDGAEAEYQLQQDGFEWEKRRKAVDCRPLVDHDSKPRSTMVSNRMVPFGYLT